MSIKPENLIELANELKAASTEVHWRSAISRGYYAAYHGCQSWHSALKAPGSAEGPPGGSHQKFVNQLGHPAPEVKGDERTLSRLLSIQLKLLHTKRCAADYQLDEVIDQVAAQTACKAAELILTKL